MCGNKFLVTYQDTIFLENLLDAWKEFIQGKKSRKDVELFQRHLMSNIIFLHEDLKRKTYTHAPYEAFKISDPKSRDIHKASVRDRLLHHAIYKKLYPYFDKRFISDSYSCRIGKGTHKAIQQFKKYANKESFNNTKNVWVLKCDIKKFFASIDQKILMNILRRYIVDIDILWLLQNIIESFHSTEVGKGLPLGNLTSQLLVNIYMNEFDQYVKHTLRVKYYIRYADDFVILSRDKEYLEVILKQIQEFLENNLKLSLHPNKVSIATFVRGVDFLGWVHFPKHKILRTVTKKRMFKKLKGEAKEETVQSYLGLLSHGDTYEVRNKVADRLSK